LAVPVVAIVVLLAGIASGYALANWGRSQAEGRLLLVATVIQPQSGSVPAASVAVTAVDLHRAGQSWSQGWTRTPVAAVALRLPGHLVAPASQPVLTMMAPVGSYDGIQVQLASRSATQVGQVRSRFVLDVTQKGLTSALVTLSVRHVQGTTLVQPGAAYGGQDEFNFGLQRAAGTTRPLPTTTLMDAQGRPFTFRELHGKVVIVASFLTQCRETCPLTAASLLSLHQALIHRGIAQDVTIVEVTQDPAHDTPSALRAYARHFHLPWTLLTGSVSAVDAFWAQLHVIPLSSLPCNPWQGTAPLDPFTGQRTPCDQQHASVLMVADPRGDVAADDLGQPTISGGLATVFRDYLDAAGRQELTHAGTWTPSSVLADILPLLQGQGVASAFPRAPGAPVPSHLAPPFTLQTTAGGRVSLAEQRGHPVVVDFFASWCTVCRAELPVVDRVASQDQSRGLRLLLLDYQESAATARNFLTSLGVNRSALLDRNGAVAQSYGVFGLPVNAFITASGRISAIQVGGLSHATLVRLLGPLLNQGG
jgi:cytochrome oxidase Cu insertion factor (SCO1/SenC/PrrC family)